MIIFNPKLKKSLTMTVAHEGIESSKLNFTFRIIVEGVEYGFPCEFDGSKVKVEIPPLSEVIKEIDNGEYLAKLEVNGDNKFYLKPFSENVTIKKEPKMEVLMDNPEKNESNVIEGLKIAISEFIDEDLTTIGFDVAKKTDTPLTGGDEEKKTEKKKRPSKISKFL